MIILVFFHDTATTEIYTYLHTLSLPDALPFSAGHADGLGWRGVVVDRQLAAGEGFGGGEGGGDLVVGRCGVEAGARGGGQRCGHFMTLVGAAPAAIVGLTTPAKDRKSTRLNSSH